MKRMVALLLGIVLLLMSVAAADDDLNEIAARVENYLEDMTDDAGVQTLEECSRTSVTGHPRRRWKSTAKSS